MEAEVAENGSGVELHCVASKEDVLKNLECPICVEIPLDPIYLCEHGHSVCGSCKGKMQYCGFCKGNFTNTRNFAMESIINASQFKCRYAGHGCSAIVTGDQYKSHVQKCDYRKPLLCREFLCGSGSTCQQMVPLNEYYNHLKTRHNIDEIQATDSNAFNLSEVIPLKLNHGRVVFLRPSLMTFDQKQFIAHAEISNHEVFWWIKLIGSDADAKNYIYERSISNQNLKTSWTMPVHPIRKSSIDIVSSSLCANSVIAGLEPYLTNVEELIARNEKICFNSTYTLKRI